MLSIRNRFAFVSHKLTFFIGQLNLEFCQALQALQGRRSFKLKADCPAQIELQKIGFIKRVDKGLITSEKDLERFLSLSRW